MGFLLLLVLVFVVIAALWAHRAREAAARLAREVRDLDGQVESLRMQVASLRGAIRPQERPESEPPAPAPTLPRPAPAPVRVSAPPSPPPPEEREKKESLTPSLPAIPAASTLSLEQRIGARWTTLLGAVVLLLATGFFLRWSFQRNLIGPAGRVTLGLLSGLGMLAAGIPLRRRPDLAYLSVGVTGFGLGALYLSLFAAHARYGLLPASAAFASMALVTVLGAGVSVWSRQQVTAVLAVLGGLLTPILVSTDHPDERVLLAYLVLLDLLALAVARFRDWAWLNRLAWAGTVVLLLPTFLATPRAPHPVARLLLLSALFGIFLLVPLLRAWSERRPAGRLDLALVLSNATAYVAAVHVTLAPWRPGLEGPAAWLLAAVYLVVGVRYRARVPDDEATEVAHLGAAATLFAAGVPLLFDGPWVTLAWAVQGAALVVLATRARSLVALAGGPILLGLAVARAAWWDRAFGPPAAVPLANMAFVVHALVVASLAFAGQVATRVRAEAGDGKSLRTLFWGLASALSVLLLWREPPRPWPEPLLAALAVGLAVLTRRLPGEPALFWGTALPATAAIAQVARALAGPQPQPPLLNLPFLLHLTVVAGLAVAGGYVQGEGGVRSGPLRAALALGAMAVLTAVLWDEPPGAWPILLLALETAALAAVLRPVPSLPLRLGVGAVAWMLLVRVLWARATSPSVPPVWNAAFLFELLAVAALAAAGPLLAGDREGRPALPIRSAFWMVACLLLALLLWQEPTGIWRGVWLMAELVGLAALSRLSPDPALPSATLALAGIVLLRVLVADFGEAHRAAAVLWNPWLFLRLAACASLALAGSLLRGVPRRILHGGAAAVLLLVLSLGWVEHQGARARAAVSAGDPGAAQRARWLGQVGLSVLWTLYAAGLLAFGFLRALPPVRYVGLGLLGIVFAKVMLLDLSRLDAIYRILSFAVLGIVLFGVAFLYQRASASRQGAT